MKHLFLLLFTSSIFAQVTLFKKADKDALNALISASATTQTAISSKEDTANKTNLQTDATSTTKFPTFGAVNDFVTPLLATKLASTAINGTLNFLPKFASATSIVNSQVVDNGTNVGIGMLTPSVKLTVNGSIKSEANNAISGQGAHLSWNRTNGDGATWLINQNGGGPGGIIFGQSTAANVLTEYARLDPTLKFMVGVATSTANVHFKAPTGTNDFVLNLQAGGESNDVHVAFTTGFNGVDTRKTAIVADNVGGFSRSSLKFVLNAAANTANYTLADTKMTLTNTGFLGIGTITPTSNLHVVGTTAYSHLSLVGAITLNGTQRYVSIGAGNVNTVTLPAANTCAGRVYTIANRNGTPRTIGSYRNFAGTPVTDIPANSGIELISDGTLWLQMN